MSARAGGAPSRGPGGAGEGHPRAAGRSPPPHLHLAVGDDEALVAFPVVLPFILIHLLHFHALPGPALPPHPVGTVPAAGPRRYHASAIAAARATGPAAGSPALRPQGRRRRARARPPS